MQLRKQIEKQHEGDTATTVQRQQSTEDLLELSSDSIAVEGTGEDLPQIKAPDRSKKSKKTAKAKDKDEAIETLAGMGDNEVWQYLLERAVDSEELKRKVETILSYKPDKVEEERNAFGAWLAACAKLIKPEKWDYFREYSQALVKDCISSYQDQQVSNVPSVPSQVAPIDSFPSVSIAMSTPSNMPSTSGLQSNFQSSSSSAFRSTGTFQQPAPVSQRQIFPNAAQKQQQYYSQGQGDYTLTSLSVPGSYAPSPTPQARSPLTCNSPNNMCNLSTPSIPSVNSSTIMGQDSVISPTSQFTQMLNDPNLMS